MENNIEHMEQDAPKLPQQELNQDQQAQLVPEEMRRFLKAFNPVLLRQAMLRMVEIIETETAALENRDDLQVIVALQQDKLAISQYLQMQEAGFRQYLADNAPALKEDESGGGVILTEEASKVQVTVAEITELAERIAALQQSYMLVLQRRYNISSKLLEFTMSYLQEQKEEQKKTYHLGGPLAKKGLQYQQGISYLYSASA